MTFTTTLVDYNDPNHAADLVFLLDHYASGESGGGKGLTEDVKTHLVSRLAKIPHAFSILCYADEKPAGLANAFHVFSTFKAKPLINIHDLIVHADFRRQGVSQLLLSEIEKIARSKNACKITLEVLDKNYPALNAYERFGFASYGLNPIYGKAIFLEKLLEY
ncbi:GCN5-related N-acetyltransferase [[Leptolyngbya] sp. PCC 7376]|uniref:GNAT family N-acetyltransferase n=1 Tax=[Leptolyngbya] sp. PCC 7376 TaxID=111781 RepID=UPI00029F4924|nr:GNAT family N-acetyltransferase [[Leptolyngbya] sp. PCC 7376]AFY36481.1 GCN5-related N-acetyltransferase [[Leptolyngbya] sp. PCC 7376]